MFANKRVKIYINIKIFEDRKAIYLLENIKNNAINSLPMTLINVSNIYYEKEPVLTNPGKLLPLNILSPLEQKKDGQEPEKVQENIYDIYQNRNIILVPKSIDYIFQKENARNREIELTDNQNRNITNNAIVNTTNDIYDM